MMTELAHVFVVREGMMLALGESSGRRWWGLPGGHLEGGESAADAAMRETFEETGLTIATPELLRTWSYTNTRGARLMCHAFAALARDGSVLLSNEHSDFAWMPVPSYAARYCSETMEAAVPEYAAFLAEMRANCQMAACWIASRGNAHTT